MKRIQRERFIPSHTRIIENKELKLIAYISDEFLTATVYMGTGKNPKMNYRYRTLEHLNNSVQEFIDSKLRVKAQNDKYKLERKERLAKEAAGVEVGDILVSSWGYSMTFVDAYQIVARKGMTVTVKPIETVTVSGQAGYTGTVKVVRDSFLTDEGTKYRLSGDSIKINSSSRAYKCDENLEHYFNKMD